MVEDIRHEATYPFPPEEVWAAITTPAAVKAWLMDTDFQGPEVGHKFEFRDKPRKLVGWNGVTHCEVLEAVPPKRFVYSFGAENDGFPPTWVSWDLEPIPGGTRVRFRHWGFTGFKGFLMRQGMNQGWAGIVRYAIPVVIETRRRGVVPTREATKSAAKAARRADRVAARGA